MSALHQQYKNVVLPKLIKEMGLKSPLGAPRVRKIVVSMGVGRAIAEKNRMPAARRELAQVTGQAPLVCRARKSVSNFKLRKGYEIGLKVTLRRARMYHFLERLINIAIPRIRDFRGLDPNSFDGRGSYSMGLTEQTVFPEIDPDKVEFQQGMNITIVTSANNDEVARQLLTMLGMPFRKDESQLRPAS